MLDLSTVGPAARCTRLLADYGARVVKVGPVPSADAAPIEPPFFAYSGHRGMRRVLLDLKDDDGRDGLPRPGGGGRRGRRELPPRRRRPAGHRLRRPSSARNPGIVYCSTSGYGQDGPHAQWAGHDLDYLAVGGYLAMSTPGVGGAPPLPGATVADAAAGGMQAALAITTALAGRATSGHGAYLDVSVAEGVLWLMSLAIDEQLALGGDIASGHDILSGRYACYGTYATADGKWVAVGAIEAKFFANLCRALGCPELAAPSSTTRRSRPSGRPSRRPSPPGPATSGSRRWPAPTPAWRPSSRCPRCRATRSSRPGVPWRWPPTRPRARCVSWRRCWPAWPRPATSRCSCPT